MLKIGNLIDSVFSASILQYCINNIGPCYFIVAPMWLKSYHNTGPQGTSCAIWYAIGPYQKHCIAHNWCAISLVQTECIKLAIFLAQNLWYQFLSSIFFLIILPSKNDMIAIYLYAILWPFRGNIVRISSSALLTKMSHCSPHSYPGFDLDMIWIRLS